MKKQWNIWKNMKQKIAIENRNGKRTELKKCVRKEPAIFCKKHEKEIRKIGRTSKFSHVNEIFIWAML